MKNTFLVLIILCLSHLGFSQKVQRDVVNSAGGHAQSNTFRITHSVGVAVIGNHEIKDLGYVSSGFTHPIDVPIVSSREEELFDEFSIELYPTFFSQEVNLRAPNSTWTMLQIMNTEGKVVYEATSSSEGLQRLDLSHLAPGAYFLKIDAHHTMGVYPLMKIN